MEEALEHTRLYLERQGVIIFFGNCVELLVSACWHQLELEQRVKQGDKYAQREIMLFSLIFQAIDNYCHIHCELQKLDKCYYLW